MARVNPVVQSLERQIAILRDQIDWMHRDPGDTPLVACGHSCVCATAEGMATNGPCICDERKLQRAVQWWRRRARFLQTTIQDMREGEKT